MAPALGFLLGICTTVALTLGFLLGIRTIVDHRCWFLQHITRGAQKHISGDTSDQVSPGSRRHPAACVWFIGATLPPWCDASVIPV